MAQSWDVATHESNEKVKTSCSNSKSELELPGQSHNFSNISFPGAGHGEGLGTLRASGPKHTGARCSLHSRVLGAAGCWSEMGCLPIPAH